MVLTDVKPIQAIKHIEWKLLSVLNATNCDERITVTPYIFLLVWHAVLVQLSGQMAKWKVHVERRYQVGALAPAISKHCGGDNVSYFPRDISLYYLLIVLRDVQ